MKKLNEMEHAVIFCYAAALLDILFTGLGIATGVAKEGNPWFAWMPFEVLIPVAITVSFITSLGGLALIPVIEKYRNTSFRGIGTPFRNTAPFIFSTVFYLAGLNRLINGAGGWYYLFRCVGYFV